MIQKLMKTSWNSGNSTDKNLQSYDMLFCFIFADLHNDFLTPNKPDDDSFFSGFESYFFDSVIPVICVRV